MIDGTSLFADSDLIFAGHTLSLNFAEFWSLTTGHTPCNVIFEAIGFLVGYAP